MVARPATTGKALVYVLRLNNPTCTSCMGLFLSRHVVERVTDCNPTCAAPKTKFFFEPNLPTLVLLFSSSSNMWFNLMNISKNLCAPKTKLSLRRPCEGISHWSGIVTLVFPAHSRLHLWAKRIKKGGVKRDGWLKLVFKK